MPELICLLASNKLTLTLIAVTIIQKFFTNSKPIYPCTVVPCCKSVSWHLVSEGGGGGGAKPLRKF